MPPKTIFFQDKYQHSCPYLDDRKSRNIYPDPSQPMRQEKYDDLIQLGFRRSGDLCYRPYCAECQACIPIRINAASFSRNRSQKRCIRRNQDIRLQYKEMTFTDEYYQLYRRYLNAQHADSTMANPTEQSYRDFLLSRWCQVKCLELREEGQLLAVAVTDVVKNGLSALYTFYDPTYRQRSLGTYAILQQIQWAASHNLPYLYLGYYIADCRKMAYKKQFSAAEYLINHQWQKLSLE